jgi:hypothetical protein
MSGRHRPHGHARFPAAAVAGLASELAVPTKREEDA